MDIIQLGAVAVSAALCVVVIRQKAPELGFALAMTACVLLLWKTMPALQEIRDTLADLAETAGVSEAILAPLLKTVGIAIVTRLSAELCRNAGESSIAAFVEIAGAAAAVLVAIPLLGMLLQLISGLL